jgi:adenylate kinase family enzyme
MKNRIMARAKASKVKRSDDNEETINKRLGVFTG